MSVSPSYLPLYWSVSNNKAKEGKGASHLVSCSVLYYLECLWSKLYLTCLEEAFSPCQVKLGGKNIRGEEGSLYFLTDSNITVTQNITCPLYYVDMKSIKRWWNAWPTESPPMLKLCYKSCSLLPLQATRPWKWTAWPSELKRSKTGKTSYRVLEPVCASVSQRTKCS